MAYQTHTDEELLVSGQDIQEPCPAGTHPAMLVDVFAGEQDEYDGRLVDTVWLVWQVFPADETGQSIRQADGRCFQAERKFTRSITPKSHLCAFLELWRDKNFTPEERAGFNLTKLKGIGCTLKIEHAYKGENTYANVIEANLIADKKHWPKAEKYVRGDYSKRTNRKRASAVTASAGSHPAVASAGAAVAMNGVDPSYVPF